MAKLVYLTNASLDGYIEDEHGAFDLYGPDDDVFAATTALLQSFGTLLYGRRLYETMAVWETNPALAEQSSLTADFASAWQAADKVVHELCVSSSDQEPGGQERDGRPCDDDHERDWPGEQPSVGVFGYELVGGHQ